MKIIKTSYNKVILRIYYVSIMYTNMIYISILDIGLAFIVIYPLFKLKSLQMKFQAGLQDNVHIKIPINTLRGIIEKNVIRLKRIFGSVKRCTDQTVCKYQNSFFSVLRKIFLTINVARSCMILYNKKIKIDITRIQKKI